MKLLLHICCAPCSVEVIKILQSKKFNITGFWYNPNIHPYTEYKSRLDTLKEYNKTIGLEIVYKDEYNFVNFAKNVIYNVNNRCNYCYMVRLEECAKYASENGFDSFTTTLLISPYQKNDDIIKICEYLSKKYNINFFYTDFRQYFREGQNKARELNLFMQKYCGCIFSEEDRYLGKAI